MTILKTIAEPKRLWVVDWATDDDVQYQNGLPNGDTTLKSFAEPKAQMILDTWDEKTMAALRAHVADETRFNVYGPENETELDVTWVITTHENNHRIADMCGTYRLDNGKVGNVHIAIRERDVSSVFLR